MITYPHATFLAPFIYCRITGLSASTGCGGSLPDDSHILFCVIGVVIGVIYKMLWGKLQYHHLILSWSGSQ